MKLWSGRFDSDTDALVDELNASIPFDKRLFREDITGSMAHAKMLGKQRIIDPAEATARQAKADLEARGLLRTEGEGGCTVCFTGDAVLGKRLAERMLDPAACEFKQITL